MPTLTHTPRHTHTHTNTHTHTCIHGGFVPFVLCLNIHTHTHTYTHTPTCHRPTTWAAWAAATAPSPSTWCGTCSRCVRGEVGGRGGVMNISPTQTKSRGAVGGGARERGFMPWAVRACVSKEINRARVYVWHHPGECRACLLSCLIAFYTCTSSCEDTQNPTPSWCSS